MLIQESEPISDNEAEDAFQALLTMSEEQLKEYFCNEKK